MRIKHFQECIWIHCTILCLTVEKALNNITSYLKKLDIPLLSDSGMGRRVYNLGLEVLKIVRIEYNGKNRVLDDFVFEDGLRQNKIELKMYKEYGDILPKLIDFFKFKNEVLLLLVSRVKNFNHDQEEDFKQFFKAKTDKMSIEQLLYDIVTKFIDNESTVWKKTYILNSGVSCEYKDFISFTNSEFVKKLKEYFLKNKYILADVTFKNLGYDNVRKDFVILDVGNSLEENSKIRLIKYESVTQKVKLSEVLSSRSIKILLNTNLTSNEYDKIKNISEVEKLFFYFCYPL